MTARNGPVPFGRPASAVRTAGFLLALPLVLAVLAPLAALAQTPEISVSDASVAEGDSGNASLYFRIALDQALNAGERVTVDYETADGTAEAGSDYTAQSGSLTYISVDEPSHLLNVLVTGDTVFEPDETLTLKLSNPSGGTIGDGNRHDPERRQPSVEPATCDRP